MQRRSWCDLWVERKTPPRGKAFYRSTSNWEEIALKFILKKISKTFYLLLPCPYSVGHHALICKRRSSLDNSRALCSRCNVKPLKPNRYHFTLDRLLDDRTLWYGCINLKQVNKGFTVCIKLRNVVTTSDLITAVNFANCLLFRQVWLLSVSETVRTHSLTRRGTVLKHLHPCVIKREDASHKTPHTLLPACWSWCWRLQCIWPRCC